MDPLVEPEEFAGYLQRDLDRYSAEQAIALASGIVRDYCGWSITRETGVYFKLDGKGTTTVQLPTLYLVDVEEVLLDEVALTIAGSGDASPAATDCQWSENGTLYRAAGWPKRFRNIEAGVTHGYATAPDVVKAVTFVLATRAMSNPEGLRSKTVGAVSKSFVFETIKGDLTELQFAQLNRHRIF